jgi:hypothetical protein
VADVLAVINRNFLDNMSVTPALEESVMSVLAALPSEDAHASGSAPLAVMEAPDENARGQGRGGDVRGGAGELESLLGELLAQLGTPDGRAEFEALVHAESENVLGKPL